jgi:hypothetical protein
MKRIKLSELPLHLQNFFNEIEEQEKVLKTITNEEEAHELWKIIYGAEEAFRFILDSLGYQDCIIIRT